MHVLDDDDDEIAYFTMRWKTRASFRLDVGCLVIILFTVISYIL